MENTNTEYFEQDKNTIAFLLLCKDISFEGTQSQGETLKFIFSPADKARNHAEKYQLGNCAPIQPKDFAVSQERVMDLIYQWKRQRNEMGGGHAR